MNSSEDVLLDLAWRRFSEVWQDKRDVETKASILLTAAGVMLGLLINAIDKLPVLAAVVSAVLLMSTIIFCVLSLKTRMYFTFGLRKSWEDFEQFEDDIEQLKLELYGALAVKEEHNKLEVSKASKWLERAMYSFLFGSGAALAGIIFLFYPC